MSAPLTATVSVSGPIGEQHRAVLASMPDQLRAVGSGGDVAMVAACVRGWTTTLVDTVRAGARGGRGVHPGADDGPDDIRAADRAVRAAGAVVLVDQPSVMSGAWQVANAGWRRDAADAVLLDSTTTVDDNGLVFAVLEQLALVRTVLTVIPRLIMVHRSTSVYQLSGHAGRTKLSLAGTRAPGSGLAIDLVGVSRRRQARFGPAGLSTPARISEWDRTGTRTEPPVYESGHRAAWRRLHAAMTAPHDRRDSRDLELLADDVEQVDTWFGPIDHRRVP